ncbi:MAG: PadR family transcriptional regulator [Lachnospiraceae bacterium]|nr:PadR family transcriptional regulator [Lachnospiraceae bacterium]
MEYIILCMLLLKKMTIYEMRTYIQRNLSTVCSDSLGSMQTTIKKLLDRGYIDVSESVENNTLKRQYSITVKGVVYFKERIGTPMNIQKMKNMEAGKFFFLGMASKEKRIAFIQSYIDDLRIEYDKLCQIHQFVENTKNTVIESNVAQISKDSVLAQHLLEVSEETMLEAVIRNIYDYQIYMLEYGLGRASEDIAFYETILERELAH